jgi:iron complex transport system ATP-binding protein
MGYPAEQKFLGLILMKRNLNDILSFDSLKIGYVSGKNKNILLPPLNSRAYSGELIAVIGRNGIGKSTLLRTIAGLQQPLGGEIFYYGENIKSYSRLELAQKVGYISTEIVKVSNMSVYDLVALGRFPHTNWIGKIDRKDHEAIMDAIEKTSMTLFYRKYVTELSDGERQKAMIARVLAQDAGIMIMDEPTAFLDIAARHEILQLLHTLSDKSRKTIIFSTHDLQMAINRSDKIWLILDNELVEGAPEDLIMAGAFEHLFDNSAISFNPGDGTFSFPNKEKGTMYLEGEGYLRLWTEKAIIRAGFSIAKEKHVPYIVTPSVNNKKWQLVTFKTLQEFSSIYELITFLGKETIGLT